MRIVICWPHLSGYMAACWRALAQRPGVDLRVLAWSTPGGDAPFEDALVEGSPVRLLDESERNDAALITKEVSRHRPDVIAIAGWFHPPYVDLALRRHGGAKFLMGMDTPWLGTLRQRLAPIKLRKLIKNIDGAMVAGERAYQYARVLGMPDGRIFRGYYGFDYDAFAPLYEQRLATAEGWPKRFVYTGRYAPEKCVPTLVDAYRDYRKGVPDPWPLTCCGHGPLKSMLTGVEGIEDLGFVQPKDLPEVLLRAGASILPSRYEPWGVVVAEALASGLPVLCTDAVGASVELVRSYHNGLTVAPEDVTVRVLNGVGIDGLARKVGGELASAGFQIVEPTNGPPTTTTTVRYGPARAAAAKTLGAAVPGAVLQPDAGTTLDLVVGDNYTGVVTVKPGDPATAKPAAAPRKTPAKPTTPAVTAADARCT